MSAMGVGDVGGSSDGYDFARYPRRSLSFKFNRRQFIGTVWQEILALGERNLGKPSFKLTDLGSMPDDYLVSLIPAMVPAWRIFQSNGFVCGQLQSWTEPVRLFPADSPAVWAFDRFDGATALGVIAAQLADRMNWEVSAGIAYVRGLFLHLVALQVCVPR